MCNVCLIGHKQAVVVGIEFKVTHVEAIRERERERERRGGGGRERERERKRETASLNPIQPHLGLKGKVWLLLTLRFKAKGFQLW